MESRLEVQTKQLHNYHLELQKLQRFMSELNVEGTVEHNSFLITHNSIYRITNNISKARAVCILWNINYTETQGILRIHIDDNLYNAMKKKHPTWFK